VLVVRICEGSRTPVPSRCDPFRVSQALNITDLLNLLPKFRSTGKLVIQDGSHFLFEIIRQTACYRECYNKPCERTGAPIPAPHCIAWIFFEACRHHSSELFFFSITTMPFASATAISRYQLSYINFKDTCRISE
jgi:hypothetical protein